jgi:Cu+-exporting ATPase
MVGTGRGAEHGILIKGGEALETAHKLTAIILDKTGTITRGTPALTDVRVLHGVSDAEFVRLVASAERRSEHPLAAAIVEGAKERGIALPASENFASHTGKGVTGRIDGRDVALGNKALLADLGVDSSALESRADDLRADGQGVMFVAIDRTLAGLVVVADPVKDSAADAIAALRRDGVTVVMLTGDNRRTAEAVARKVGGIDEVIADVLPEQKQAIVDRLRKQGRRVAMAGDGINDAPALAAADVGIAMGTGTDVAMESAAITMVKGDLGGIVRARRLSRAVMRNIRQNLFFSLVFNAAGVPIAAGVLYPWFGILLSPIIAGAAMAFSSVSVIGNSLRLRGVRL